jgi:hypothetical protein
MASRRCIVLPTFVDSAGSRWVFRWQSLRVRGALSPVILELQLTRISVRLQTEHAVREENLMFPWVGALQESNRARIEHNFSAASAVSC